MLYKIFGGMVIAVAAISFLSSAEDGAAFAGSAMHTIGVTAGALVTSFDGLMEGFTAGQTAGETVTPTTPETVAPPATEG